ncbi:MAG: hypothetical protein JRF70_10040 [Deltaproteobacteria bacterium]|nr:hypothetical protein [Deltaproteobacteria bacterium]
MWRAPSASLEARVLRTRRAALEQGVWSLDVAAQVLLEGAVTGEPLERAESALRLAPDAPAVRMEHARALWLHGASPITALRAAIAALLVIPRHVEASLWFGGNALLILALALAAGGLFFIGLTAVFVAPPAAHVLGDLISRDLPGFSRTALLATLVLLPWVLGEGLLGLVVALLAVGSVFGSMRQRLALGVAVASVWAGGWWVPRLAGATLEAFQRDPVAEAAYSSARGVVMAQDLARLEAADPDDLLAARARAMYAKRSGNLAQADAEYRRLLEVLPHDPTIANNAANVRLALGHMGDAIDLYRQAASESGSPIVLFNLAQAHGLTFQVDELSRALTRAQELDREAVARLSELQRSDNTAFVVDLPLPASLMWRRILGAAGGEALAAQLRGPLAPGHLAGKRAAGLALCGVALSGSIVGLGVRARRKCGRCGRLLCPRCEPESGDRDVCAGCFQLFYKSEDTDRSLRKVRVEVLRKRERSRNRMAWGVAVVVPGAAGLLARRPLRGFLAAVLFALAAACILLRDGVVADPLVVGAAGPIGFVGLGTLAALAYALVLATSLAARRRA